MSRSAAVPALAAALAVALLAPPLSGSLLAQEVGAQPSRWWGEVDRIGGFLAEGKWKKVAGQGGDLRDRVMRESWREPDLSLVLAELAFQLAVASAEAGDAERAVWEWHSALVHERHGATVRGGRGEPLAERDLSAYPEAAELFAAHPPRSAGEYPDDHPRIDPGPLLDFVPATAPPFAPAPLVNSTATHETVAPVHFEVFVAPSGEIAGPVLLTEWSHPVVVQWGLDSLRASPRFEPARLDGEPVGWPVPVELTLSSRSPKRW